MAKKIQTSPKMSLAGWDWKVWLKKNSGTVRTFVAATFALFLALATAIPDDGPTLAAIKAATIGLVVLATKLALDIFDFFVSDVEIG